MGKKELFSSFLAALIVIASPGPAAYQAWAEGPAEGAPSGQEAARDIQLSETPLIENVAPLGGETDQTTATGDSMATSQTNMDGIETSAAPLETALGPDAVSATPAPALGEASATAASHSENLLNALSSNLSLALSHGDDQKAAGALESDYDGGMAFGDAQPAFAASDSASAGSNGGSGDGRSRKAKKALAKPKAAKAAPSDRLPDSVRPEAYDLHVTADPNNKKEEFSGAISIRVQVEKKTKEIVLHSLDLDFQFVSISVNGIETAPLPVVKDAANEMIRISLPNTLEAGPAKLRLHYTGKFNKQMKGFYLSTAKYKGKDERYAFTQFEATDARRMFPCFDEPAMKATFKLTVTAPKNLTVISNMPAEKETVDGSMKTTAFQTSPKMATYLLALFMARLVPTEVRKVGGTEIRVWTMPDQIGQAGFALDEAVQAVQGLNAYFNIPYQLPKMDLVAVPDFAMGAMENWGAISFRDSAILVDPKLSSIRSRKRVAEVVTHEIVHQWFGDLVTMKWWNDLWLNEAFATWLSYKIVDQWHPEYRMWDDFEDGKAGALAIDSIKNTRPVSSNVSSSAEIEAQFDPLSYEKGGAVLRMMDNFLSSDKFRAGLRRYMAKYKYQNTEAKNLWAELETASGQPVSRIAKDWITKPAYPIISVKPVSKDNRKLLLVQSRYSAYGSVKDSALWNIPVVIKYKDASGIKSFRVNLTKTATEVSLPGDGPVEWVYTNQDQTGFYRSLLDEKLLAALGPAVTTGLNTLERGGLLNDLWAETKSRRLSLSTFLDFLQNYKADEARTTLQDETGYLGALYTGLAQEKDKPKLAQLTQEIMEPHWKRLGWGTPQDDDETKLSRAAVLGALGSIVKPEGLIKEVRARLDAYLKDPSSLDPSLVPVVLSLGAKTGDAKLLARYQKALRAAKTPEQRNALMAALAQFEQPELAKQVLKMTLTDAIRGQDIQRPLAVALSNTKIQGLAWQFLQDHWAQIRKKGGSASSGNIIGALGALSSKTWIKQIKGFFAKPKNQEKSAARDLAQALEFAELGVQFKDNQAKALSSWLRGNKAVTDAASSGKKPAPKNGFILLDMAALLGTISLVAHSAGSSWMMGAEMLGFFAGVIQGQKVKPNTHGYGLERTGLPEGLVGAIIGGLAGKGLDKFASALGNPWLQLGLAVTASVVGVAAIIKLRRNFLRSDRNPEDNR